MTKLKKKLTVITAIFALIAVLGSTAVIFAKIKYEPVEPGVITSDVGYILGTDKGSGEYASNEAAFTFAPSFINSIETESLDFAYKKTTLMNFVKKSENVTSSNNNVVSLEADENGDTHLTLSTNESSTTDSAALMFPLGMKNLAIRPYNARSGKYIIEFDIKIDGDYESVRLGNIMEFCFNAGYLGNANKYTSTYFYPSEVEGYYTYSAWGTRENALSGSHKLLKYGEWYNMRFELTLDNSTNFALNVDINGVRVEKTTGKVYSMIQQGNAAPRYAPNAFSIIPRTSQNLGMDICIDNVYSESLRK